MSHRTTTSQTPQSSNPITAALLNPSSTPLNHGIETEIQMRTHLLNQIAEAQNDRPEATQNAYDVKMEDFMVCSNIILEINLFTRFVISILSLHLQCTIY